MAIIVAATGFGVVSYPNIVKAAGETWLLLIVVGFAVSAFVAFVCGLLSYRFPNQTVFDYARELLGKPISKVLAVVYLGFFFLSTVMMLNHFSNSVVTVLLPHTPVEVILGTFLIATVFLSSRGVNIISRVAKILIVIAIAVILAMLVFTLKKFNFEETYGMWKWRPTDVKTAILSSAPVFFGFESVLIIGGFAKKTKKMMISVPGAVLIVGGIIFLIQFIMVGVFSTVGITHLTFPTIELAKTIAFQTALAQRFDVIYMFGWIISIFLSIAIMQYCAAFSLAHLIEAKDYSMYCLLLAPLSLFAALLPEQQRQVMMVGYYYGALGLVVAFGVPILLGIIALVRGRFGKESIMRDVLKEEG